MVTPEAEREDRRVLVEGPVGGRIVEPVGIVRAVHEQLGVVVHRAPARLPHAFGDEAEVEREVRAGVGEARRQVRVDDEHRGPRDEREHALEVGGVRPGRAGVEPAHEVHVARTDGIGIGAAILQERLEVGVGSGVRVRDRLERRAQAGMRELGLEARDHPVEGRLDLRIGIEARAHRRGQAAHGHDRAQVGVLLQEGAEVAAGPEQLGEPCGRDVLVVQATGWRLGDAVGLGDDEGIVEVEVVLEHARAHGPVRVADGLRLGRARVVEQQHLELPKAAGGGGTPGAERDGEKAGRCGMPRGASGAIVVRHERPPFGRRSHDRGCRPSRVTVTVRCVAVLRERPPGQARPGRTGGARRTTLRTADTAVAPSNHGDRRSSGACHVRAGAQLPNSLSLTSDRLPMIIGPWPTPAPAPCPRSIATSGCGSCGSSARWPGLI